MSKKQKSLKQKILNLPRRTKLIIACSLIGMIVVVVAAAGLLIGQHHSDTSKSANSSNEARLQQKAKDIKHDGAIRTSARSAIDKGDYNRANQIYSDSIKSEPDGTRKVELAIDQSSVLYDAGKYAEAIKAARDADAYSEDKFLIADWLSRIYEDQRQYALAAQYYTMAGKFASSPTNSTGYTKSYYDQQAARVSALAGQTR